MQKLYYEDNYLKTFTATVTACEPAENGFWVTLDATAFYPEGGGQACDTGTLGDARVLDVQEAGDSVRHLCDKPLTPGSCVQGRIDWERRFDLMQQHTGEHIVSGLLNKAFGCHNTGFHVGKDVLEVDFDCLISPDALAQIEYEANRVIWQDLPLQCWVPSPQELPDVYYRTKRALPWPVRIVQIPDCDSCACCGIHVARTGEVGLIKILSCVKFHGGIRLEMVCGARAYQWMKRIFDENKAVSQALSAPITATADAAHKLGEALAAEKLRANALQSRLFDQIAQSYVNRANILHFAPGLDAVQVRLLADRIAGCISGTCAVFSGSDGAFVYCLAAREADLRPLNRQLCDALSGRGGGKPNFQQGSLRCTQQAIEAFFAGLSTFL